MTHELAGDLRDIIEDFKNHRLRTSVERLAEWMLRSDQRAGGTGRFAIPYDKRTLASYLGMTPENLSRNLASLTSVGVAVHGPQVTLNDRAALAAFARMDATPRARGY
jgi:CRP/FNR family transcriptional regulator, transcriptional activator FtrB